VYVERTRKDVQEIPFVLQHLPNVRFNLNEYSEYPDENRDKGFLAQTDEQQYIKDNLHLRANNQLGGEEITANFDKSMSVHMPKEICE